MSWLVKTTDRFDAWFDGLKDKDRENVLACMLVLQSLGPGLSRPYADTVKGSRYANMKELRVQSAGKPLRAFYAFDPQRSAVLLCAGDKTGDEKLFYKKMVPLADAEFSAYLHALQEDS